MELRLHVVLIVEADGSDYSLDNERNLRIKSNVTSTAEIRNHIWFLNPTNDKVTTVSSLLIPGGLANHRHHALHTKINNTVNTND